MSQEDEVRAVRAVLSKGKHKVIELDCLGRTVRFEQFGGPEHPIEFTVRDDHTGGSTTRLMYKDEARALYDMFKCVELIK
jgi:hypothetical protein